MSKRYIGRDDFRHDQAMRIGVLLVNLGTPKAPDTRSVRRYLKEFLSDPRVIEVPRLLWWLILNGVILRIRPARSARAYRSVWTDSGSPLLVFSRAQAAALAQRLEQEHGDACRVELAMTYGQPGIAEALDALAAQNVTRLFVMPLYPQYSATTTGAVFDALSRQLSRHRLVPDLIFQSGYHDDPAYIEALAHSIREHWQAHGEPQQLLFSFHGIPRRYFLAGDPYHCQCHATARLVARALDWPDERWSLAFQSRVGREPWLTPYTDQTLQQWGEQGIGTVHVVCPGFAADCLETLEEIAVENAERFTAAGGGALHYIPALNAQPEHIAMMAGRVAAATSQWLPWAHSEQQRVTVDETAGGDARTQRAKAMGAPR